MKKFFKWSWNKKFSIFGTIFTFDITVRDKNYREDPIKDAVTELLRAGKGKIEAIRRYRTMMTEKDGVTPGLTDSKNYVDAIDDQFRFISR